MKYEIISSFMIIEFIVILPRMHESETFLVGVENVKNWKIFYITFG